MKNRRQECEDVCNSIIQRSSMATLGLLQALILCFIITTVVSQQPIVSVDEIEDGGTFSVTCDVSRVGNLPSDVTDITGFLLYRQTSQDTETVILAQYYFSGLKYKGIPRGREWTVDFTGANNGTNNRDTMKIVIQVSDAVCQDAGVYYCFVSYRESTGGRSSVRRPQCVTSKSCVSLQTNQEGLPVVSQQPIVSVDEIEDGGTFSVTCDASRVGHIPSNVTEITYLRIDRQTSQDTGTRSLALCSTNGYTYERTPRGREWTVEVTGDNSGTNNRDTMKIVIQVKDAVCQDAGVYECRVRYRNSTGGLTSVTSPQCVTSKCKSGAVIVGSISGFILMIIAVVVVI